MNATKAELSKLQERIAGGRPPTLDGRAEEFYWHPTIAGFGLRLYANGSATWLVQYRNKRGLQRRHRIGNAAVLNLNMATNTAKRVLGDIANGFDPQGEREEALAKPKFTLGAMAKRFLDERQAELSPNTHKCYANAWKNHLGKLATMQVDEIEPLHIADKVSEIAKAISAHVALHTRSLVSSIYKWGKQRGLITVPNPVQDTWKPETPESVARPLGIEELGAIWRAAEAMAESAAEMLPAAANSVRAGSALLSRTEAARQSGLGKSALWGAIRTGKLRAKFRRELPDEEHLLKIKQGYHRRAYMIEAAELDRFVGTFHVRTAQADYAAIVRLLVLLGGRYSEMAALRWSELDLDKGVLHIKGRRTEERRGTKNKRDLRLPLSPMAIGILKEIKPRPGRDLLFGDGPNGLLNSARLKDQLDARIAEMEGQPLKPWRNHDLRHSISTHMNEMGIDPRVVETIVNHYSGHRQGIAGRYNHATYDVQVKQALEVWARTIRNVADGVELEAANVVAFGKPLSALG